MALSITKPTVGGSEDTWGTTINTALDDIVSYANTAPQLGDANTFTAAQTVSADFAVTNTGFATVTIESTGATQDAVLALKNDNGGAAEWTARLDQSDSKKLQIRYNNTDYLTIDTSGNIGIGTSSPSYLLDVRGTVGLTGLLPITDNAYDVGSASFRFDDVYATNGTIQTSDQRQKQDVEELDEAERRVAVRAKALLRKYRWKDAVANKGDDARIHIGIMAQDLIRAFEDEGLDAFRYAMIVGNEEEGYGVRYHELLAFIIAAW